jgi:uncharacterized membrane protein YkoI
MIRSKFIPVAMIAVLGLAGAGAAFAGSAKRADNEQNETAAVLAAKISLTQAIAEAERQAGGKAVQAGVENQNGSIAYDVEVASGTTVQKVLVDPTTGKVLKIAPHTADTEKDGDNDND